MDSRSEEDDVVWIATTGGALPATKDCEIVLSLDEYEGDLGMRRARAVRKQLDLDVPRSVVHVCGTRVWSANEVLLRARHPRMCTQAVLAPVLEWFARQNVIAHEIGAPMHVDVSPPTTTVRKRLGLLQEAADTKQLAVDVCITARAPWVLVSLTFHFGFDGSRPTSVAKDDSARPAVISRIRKNLLYPKNLPKNLPMSDKNLNLGII